MKLHVILPTLILGLGVSNAPLQQVLTTSSAQISSFDDFIASQTDLENYYQNVSYFSGEDLITKLESIIEKNNVKPNYHGNFKSLGSWGTYALVDRDFDKSPLKNDEITKINSGKQDWWQPKDIFCNVMYEDEPIEFKGNSRINGQYQYNREHVYPKSHGFNDPNNKKHYEDIMAGCDIHNLHMAENNANMLHSNYPYGNINLSTSESSTSVITKKSNANLGVSTKFGYDNVFEPHDKDKGDIARSIFYMATRYHTYDVNNPEDPRLVLGNSNFNGLTVTPQTTQNKDIVYGILDDLLEWNELDQCDKHEEIRNSLVHTYIQKNRNPYIDFPKWVDVAFNPESIYVSDINAPDGIRLKFTLKNDLALKPTYSTKEGIDTSSITFEFADKGQLNTLNFNDVTATLKNVDTNKQTDVSKSENITFTEAGNYELSFKYQNDLPVITKTFEVTAPLSLDIELGEPIYKDYIVGNTIRLKNKKNTVNFETYKEQINANDPRFTYKLTNTTFNSDYIFNPNNEFRLETAGTYKFEVNFKEGGSTLNQIYNFNVKEFKDSVVIKGLETLQDEIYIEDKLDVSKVTASFVEYDKVKEIKQSDIHFDVLDKDEKLITSLNGSNSKTYYVDESASKIKVSINSPYSLGSYETIVNLTLLNPKDTIKIVNTGNINTEYYEDDVLDLDNIEVSYYYRGQNHSKTYTSLKVILINKDDSTEKRIYNTTHLKPGSYKLAIEFDYLGDSKPIRLDLGHEFIVKPLSESIETNAYFEQLYNVGDELRLDEILFTYKQNGKIINLNFNELTYTLQNVETGRVIKIEDPHYKFEDEGTYNLKISYTTENNTEIKKEFGFKVEKKIADPSNDENQYLTYAIIGGVCALVIIIAMSIILVKAKKKK